MFNVLSRARKIPGHLFAFLFVMLAVACQPVTTSQNGPSINTDRPVPVALLVPAGSGNAGYTSLAQSLENAARLAISDLDGAQIDLRVYSTAGNADQAAAVAMQAVNDGAKIILGPVFADAANAAGVAVANRNINVLAFSNNTEIAGGNVFVLGNTFENTANRLVQYGTSQGRSNIYIVHGNDTAEQIGRDAIATAVRNSGATLAGVAGFELSQTALVQAIPTIAREVRSTGADTVFFTSGTDGALPLLTQLLSENGVSTETAQFVGLRRFDVPAAAISLPGIQEGLFAIPDPQMAALFRSRYEAAFAEAPHPIAGLAYDGIAAIGALINAGQQDALTTTALTQGSGFVGVSGIFRLRTDGANERGLAVATIRDNQVVQLDPAPRRFGGAGF
ncbi:penicillin-binding protein activator [Cochlodiniinecator piscidefendens]|uniref:penicillin-binding protein activator n=1 Tax=Cochlodiniinecator piscidefendens TaxID=2715756 RepID=UPI00140BF93F|nr:penicillin-binding protein activator [Cochlodiniinecator piscidefendens]